MGTGLEEKYRSGQLSLKELHQLREKVDKATEEALASEMKEHWLNGSFEDSPDSQERLSSILSRLQTRIRCQRRLAAAGKWISIAAAVILPLCLLFTFSNYRTVRHQSEQLLVISTGKGEMSNITLPDGTLVKLNELSELKYSPGRFGNRKRELTFNGEAYFQVEKEEECPFVIDADMMAVTVLGTKFNLSARLSDPSDKVFLSEGRVQIVSKVNGENVVINPNEEVSLDKQTGKILVTRQDDSESTTSWVQKEIVLKGISLKEVLDILSDKYNVEFSCGNGIDTGEFFTGTLPTDNLIDCTRILEYAFGVKIRISGEKVVISK